MFKPIDTVVKHVDTWYDVIYDRKTNMVCDKYLIPDHVSLPIYATENINIKSKIVDINTLYDTKEIIFDKSLHIPNVIQNIIREYATNIGYVIINDHVIRNEYNMFQVNRDECISCKKCNFIGSMNNFSDITKYHVLHKFGIYSYIPIDFILLNWIPIHLSLTRNGCTNTNNCISININTTDKYYGKILYTRRTCDLLWNTPDNITYRLYDYYKLFRHYAYYTKYSLCTYLVRYVCTEQLMKINLLEHGTIIDDDNDPLPMFV